MLSESEIPSELIQVNDTLKVLPGAVVPCDGVVVFGLSEVNESMVTGESLPVSKQIGSEVIGGTVNQSGVMHVRAMRVGADATLASITRLVQEAQVSKAPVQAFADRIAGLFVPAVVILALVVFVVWMVVGRYAIDREALPRKMTPTLLALLHCISVLVIACPCGLGLATPTAVMVGTGMAARMGLLIKGGAPLESAHRTRVVMFDKTGTQCGR